HEHDDRRGRHTEGLRQVADGDTGLDGHRSGRSDDLAGGLRSGGLAVALLLASVARARGSVVDDDAPLAPLTGTTLTRPHRAVWSVRAGFVRHQDVKCRGMSVPARPGRSAAACG